VSLSVTLNKCDELTFYVGPLVSFSAENDLKFSVSFRFRAENDILFSVHFRFRAKTNKLFTVGLYIQTVSIAAYLSDSDCLSRLKMRTIHTL